MDETKAKAIIELILGGHKRTTHELANALLLLPNKRFNDRNEGSSNTLKLGGDVGNIVVILEKVAE